MFFVEAVAAGQLGAPWDEGATRSKRYLMRALDAEGSWFLDGKAVEIEAGIVVGTTVKDDVEHFTASSRKQAPRAERVEVIPGDVVVFAEEADAQSVVAAGMARSMSMDEVMERARAVHEAATAGESPEAGQPAEQPHAEPDVAEAPHQEAKRRKHKRQ